MNYRTKEEDDKLFDSVTNCRVKCKKCGHTVLLPKYKKTVCTHCGSYIFKNDAEEFKFRLMEKIGKKYE